MSHSRDPGVRRQTGPMTEAQTWTAVDDLITGLLVQPDAALGEALAANDAAGLPAIDVTPALGAMLHVLARSVGARRILEIGTLGGYSTIWLARSRLPRATRACSGETSRVTSSPSDGSARASQLVL